MLFYPTATLAIRSILGYVAFGNYVFIVIRRECIAFFCLVGEETCS